MQNDKKKNRFLFKVMLVQAITVGLIVLLLALIKSVNPDDYKAIAVKYLSVADTKGTEAKIDEKFEWLKAYFLKDKSSNAGGKDIDVEGRKYPENCSASKYVISADITVPVNGYISSPFGYRIHPVNKKLSFHTGVDIAADEGTPVYSAYYGIVEAAGEDEVYGNYILLNHGNGIKTFYGHCRELCVETGEQIKEGTKIATVGTTGWSTGPHCHFEIRINGVYCNPSYVLNLNEG